jgi:DNA helicase-2/ATP-dependent DNA helicase PcrA
LRTDIDEWDDTKDVVTLMTLHMAKGLEFPVVVVAGMEDGLFPHVNTMMTDRGLEEERRLCYVGLTRAKQRIILTSADVRRVKGAMTAHAPSQFLSEIPEEFFDNPVTHTGGYPSEDEYRHEMPDYEGSDFSVGDMIEHSTFGMGRIDAISGSGEGMKVAVRFFRDNKQRDLLVKYACLRKR